MCDFPHREAAMNVVKDGVWCDPCLTPLVTLLNDSGPGTRASCCGHGRRPGVISLTDGRQMLILDDFESARALDGVWPGINDEPARLVLAERGAHVEQPEDQDPCKTCGVRRDEHTDQWMHPNVSANPGLQQRHPYVDSEYPSEDAMRGGALVERIEVALAPFVGADFGFDAKVVTAVRAALPAVRPATEHGHAGRPMRPANRPGYQFNLPSPGGEGEPT